MANFYGKDRDVDFAASKLMSFGKSFSRMNGQPLDESEVWYDKTALEAFAAGNSAYVGMKLVYVDETNQKVYQYSVQYDGSIKEIGVAPLGDSKSIVVDAETGTVSLKGIDSLVFEREVEGGEKEDVQYQPLMTKNGLVWVEPSKTTVEGLATLIEALTVRVKANEDAIGVASKAESAEGAGDGVVATGLHKKIEDEVARALAAEAALDGKIAAIDFVDTDELATALEPYAKTEDVNTELAKKAEKTALEALQARVEAFLDNTGAATEAIDTLQELIDYINTHDDTDISGILASIQAIEGKLAGIDSTVVAYVTAAIEALKIGDYAKAADLTALADRVKTLEGKVDVDKVSEAIGAAEGRAATDATNKANAVKEYVGEFTTGEDNYKDLTSVVAYINKKAEETLAAAQGGSSETAASVKLQLDNYKTENDAKVKANTDKLATIEENAQVNVIESVEAIENAKIVVSTAGKKVTIDDGELVRLINVADGKGAQGISDAAAAAAAASAAQGTANQGVSDAAAAQATADTAKGIADQNKADIAAHATEFATLKGRVDAHDTSKANAADVYTKEQVNAITGTPDEGKTLVAMIAEKANAANVYIKSEVFTKTETAAEIKKVTGEVPADSSLMNEIAKAQAAATYNDTEVRGLISGNATAIENITKAEDGAIAVAVKAEADRATGVEQGLDNRLKEVETFFAAVESPDETIDTLAEIVSYIESDKSGAAELTGKVNKNTTDIGALTDRVIANETAIATTLPNAIAAAIKETEDYADAEIAKINVLATIEAITGEDGSVTKTAKKGLILPEVDKFEMTDGKVTAISTDLLKNGSMTLILNGGTAKD